MRNFINNNTPAGSSDSAPINVDTPEASGPKPFEIPGDEKMKNELTLKISVSKSGRSVSMTIPLAPLPSMPPKKSPPEKKQDPPSEEKPSAPVADNFDLRKTI